MNIGVIIALIALAIISVSVVCGVIMSRMSGRLALGLSTGISVASMLIVLTSGAIQIFFLR